MGKRRRQISIVALFLAAVISFAGSAAPSGQILAAEITEEAGPLVAVESKKPARVKLKKVIKNAPYATVRWKNVKKRCTGYEIYVSTKKKFPALNTTVYQRDAGDNEITLSLGLTGTYYVKVRAYYRTSNVDYFGKFSKVKKIKMS